MAAAVLLGGTMACSSLSPVWDPARFIAETKPPVVYVMRGREAILTLTNPRVSGDTVLGTLPGESEPVALPLSDVQNIGTVRLNGRRTALLIGGVASVGALAVFAFFTNANGRSSWSCDYNEPTENDERDPCGFNP